MSKSRPRRGVAGRAEELLGRVERDASTPPESDMTEGAARLGARQMRQRVEENDDILTQLHEALGALNREFATVVCPM